ncbi:MAG: HD domain-containing protein [Desulfonatronovibrio sp.]
MKHTPWHIFLDPKSRAASLSGRHGRQALNRLSRVTDEYFIHRLAEIDFSGSPDTFLVAVGGYGRQEMSLKSDIDVLVISDKTSENEMQKLASSLFHPLWDAGLDVGHGVRTSLECLDLASRDFRVLASLLDLRFICGRKEHYRVFSEKVRALLKQKSSELAGFLMRQELERAGKKTAENYMEPDIKNDPGGLRDYHLVLWLEKIFDISDSKQGALLCDKSRGSLLKEIDFIFDLRNELHSLGKKKNDRLYSDLQPELSRKMGYRGSSGKSGVEIFLEDLFKCQNRISALAQQAVERSAGMQEGAAIMSPTGTRDPGRGILERNGRLCFSPQADPAGNPGLALDILRAQARSGVTISRDTTDRINTLLEDPRSRQVLKQAMKKFFPEILSSRYPSQCLRSMHQSGFLRVMIPELSGLWFFVQFDGVHTYPLGEHVLHCLDAIASLEDGGGFLSEYLGSYADSLSLRMAALLHDIGKGEPDHAEAGAQMAGVILERFEIRSAVAEEVLFLVRNHLLMVHTALKRDIEEESVVAGFAGQLTEVHNLNLLTCLSFADSIATGPKVWSSWQENLIRKLYFKTRHLMQHTILAGYHAGHRMAMVRDRIRSHPDYNDSWEESVQAMPMRYLLKIPVSEIIKHIRLAQSFENKEKSDSASQEFHDFILLPEENKILDRGYLNLTLVSRDQPGLLAAMAAALAVNQIEIYCAGLFTWENGLAVDLFKVSPPVDHLYADKTWTEVRKDFNSWLGGQRNMQQFCKALRKTPAAGARFRINLDNYSSDFHTIIEVNSPRHPCLTWQISLCLAELGMDISHAVISSHKDQSLHVFYVRDHEGQKLAGDRKKTIKQIHSAVRLVV